MIYIPLDPYTTCEYQQSIIMVSLLNILEALKLSGLIIALEEQFQMQCLTGSNFIASQ